MSTEAPYRLRIRHRYIVGTTTQFDPPLPEGDLIEDLVAVLEPEGFQIGTDRFAADVWLHPTRLRTSPPELTELQDWEEAVEISFYAECATDSAFGYVTFDDAGWGPDLPGPGMYRAMVCARGRLDRDNPDELAHFQVFLWPAEKAPPIVHKSIGFEYLDGPHYEGGERDEF